ncbi:TetR/AcrR family transcriptional regulator [Flammeovirga sp. SubArs3]|uniref:TetR/AcrR family transcriptional regulator n=1 Tax=Flammeovirga sp. SubArs3 TaxID=2995316 RepID=UPI00248AB18E|nr:TetR/AcrR family transcriptional regulator [Flammeovirga sp. SubArs3]
MEKQQLWINAGYKVYSTEGPNGLKVERLAKVVGVSKSSFYHYFADLECFIDDLFRYHLEQCKIIAEKERHCEKIHPDLIDIFIEHKTDLLFQRQLRIHQKEKQAQVVLSKSKTILGNFSEMAWAQDIYHPLTKSQLNAIFQIVIDDFYMKINEDNLNHEFLGEYMKGIQDTTKQLIGQLYTTV